MTKEEAIEWLKSLNYCDGEETQEVAQAIDEAIKALEQQKPLEKFENVKDHICKLADDYKCWDNRLSHEESLELCNILKQQSDDCVSREKVWYMITGGKYPNEDYEQFIDRLVKELENMPPVTPTFPKGATNGDMIKAMFDCQEDEKQWGNDNKWVTFKAKNNPSHNFDLDWWNAPYKRGSEDGSN